MKNNTIIFYNTDMDGWMKHQFAIKCPEVKTFKEAYNLIKHILESDNVVNYVKILTNNKEIENYKFISTDIDEGLTYTFRPILSDDEDDDINFNFEERNFLKTFE